jgi:hypothetical protein
MGLDLTGIGSVAILAKSILDIFVPPQATPAEKDAMQLQMESLIQLRDNAILDAQKSIIVAEMSQEDKYTKRARPTVVYSGLVFIFLVHVAFPLICFQTKETLPNLNLPDLFWQVWGGVCAVWMLGRTAEKMGISNPVINRITGTK